MDKDLPILDDCWNRTGVQGDHTCPSLKEHVHCRNCPTYSSAGRTLFERTPPKNWEDELSKALATSIAETQGDSIPMVIFRIGQEYFGLEATSLVEVASTRVVHGIPNRVGGLLEGIVNIRGELQLCVSLEKFLGIEKNQGDETLSREKMLVLEKSGQRWVTKVDEVFAVFRIVKKEISPTPATVKNSFSRFTKGIFEWNGKKAGHLDDTHFFEILEKSIS